jgi:periplasmic divalent cation tolerance protein
MADDYVLVLTTLPQDGDPLAFARALVNERLAACVNVQPPMTSVYVWEGEVAEDAEHQLTMKTLRSRVPALWERLRELHPYDVPEFIVLPIIDGSDAYLKWIADSTGDNS